MRKGTLTLAGALAVLGVVGAAVSLWPETLVPETEDAQAVLGQELTPNPVVVGRLVGKSLLRPDDQELVARGSAIYAGACASCHGAALEGQPNWRQRGADGRLPAPPHDGSGHTWHHPDEALFELVRLGPAAIVGEGYPSAMPGYRDVLADEEIVAVLSYIKSTWPPEVRARHDRINEAE